MASSAHFGKTRRVLGIAVTALVLAVAAGSIGARPALADDGWHRGYERHGWREHEWREHEWRERHHHVYYAPGYYPGYYVPGYVYEPPPVVYERPPVVYAPPSISFVFPLGHR